MGKIFSEFFTNLAVATLSVGILAPLFTQVTIPSSLTMLSLAGSGILIASAIITKDLK